MKITFVYWFINFIGVDFEYKYGFETLTKYNGIGFYIGHSGTVIIDRVANSCNNVIIVPISYIYFDVANFSLVDGNLGVITNSKGVDGYNFNQWY